MDPPGGLPTGCVFSALMMAITIGGMVYTPLQSFFSNYLISKEKSPELCASFVYFMAALSMAVPALFLSTDVKGTFEYVIISFLVVECCVGLFMPVAGTLRSKYVPDALQGAILNIFRLPLNVVVVSGTYATDVLEASLVFKLVSGCFLAAALLQGTFLLEEAKSIADNKKKD
jgi:MFS transporter, MFS domain-containing protein family, molybdate-anion transporter